MPTLDDIREAYYKGQFKLAPLLDDDVDINNVTDLVTIPPGGQADFSISSGETYYFYAQVVAATFAANLQYEIIIDMNETFFVSNETPSSIGDYRNIFIKPRRTKNVVLRVTNFGLFPAQIQAQFVGWLRPEQKVHLIENNIKSL
jgi:hypothetical protein